MKWLIEITAISCAIYFGIIYVGDVTPTCNCAKLPKDYFVVETKETEMCIDENRQSVITKVVKSGKVEIN